MMRWGLEGTVLLDPEAEYARALGVRGVPTNIYVGADGIVRAVGATTADAMLAEAARLEPRLLDDADGAGNGIAGANGTAGGNGDGDRSEGGSRPLRPNDFVDPAA